MAKLLAVHPGASYATGDVFVGYHRALLGQGHDLVVYALDARIDLANEFYHWAYRKQGLGSHPPSALVLQHACGHIVPQALYHQVDGVIVWSAMRLHPDTLVLLKRAGIPTAVILSESPYDDREQARVLARRERGEPVVDIAFTNERASLPYLRQYHPNVQYLAHAYDPHTSRTTVMPGMAPRHDVLFIGTMFEERAALLGSVDWEAEGIDLGIYGMAKNLGSRHRLRKFVRGGIVDNHIAQSYYRTAKIVLNPYRTSRGFGKGVEHIDHAESLNPRALELAACGAFSLSEHRAEVAEVFGPLVPTYTGPADFLTNVRYFLEHGEERDALRKQLPGAVKGHTYAARAAELMAHIEASWSPRGRVGAASA